MWAKVHDLRAFGVVWVVDFEGPASGLRGIARQREAAVLQQVGRVLGNAVPG